MNNNNRTSIVREKFLRISRLINRKVYDLLNPGISVRGEFMTTSEYVAFQWNRALNACKNLLCSRSRRLQ